MAYAQVRGCAGYGDEVVADGHVQSFVAHIGVCRLHDVPYLHRREHIHGTALPFRAACLHLHKDQCALCLCNDVHLLVPSPPVPVQYDVSLGPKVIDGSLFAQIAIFIVACHNLILIYLLQTYKKNITLHNKPKGKAMADDIFYMKAALAEAKKAYEEDEVPVGAVIVCKDRIIARAHNLTERLTDVTAHAEMQAITSAQEALGGKYLNECALYVTVEPCIMCAGAIGWSQMGRVVFGASDEKRGYQRFAPQALHPRTDVTSGIMEEECATLMKSFFKQKR